ncbi:hypothetical protein M422DRAFT_241332 [Sphaerobolus stellatus SS14]|nr:hypothetical protein M422DRAFT_241332 [Sphaerobolus stellatus SS14]
MSSPEIGIIGEGYLDKKMFLTGTSAGGAHAGALFLDEMFLGELEIDRRLFGGVISEENLANKTPNDLVKNQSEDKELLLPKVLIFTSNLDPPIFFY